MKSVRSERVNDSEGVGRENENERGKKKAQRMVWRERLL